MQDKENGSFSFIHERIKEKPLNKKRVVFWLVFAAAAAVVFGVVSAFVFTYFQPKFERKMYPKGQQTVTIPKDHTEELESSETEKDETEMDETETETESETQEPDTEQESAQTKSIELEPEDFQRLQNKLYAVGREANRSIVTVTSVKSNTDWFNNPYESKGQTSGIIVGDNGEELLILTERKEIAEAREIYVNFFDDTAVEAQMKKYDGNTGITILSVPKVQIKESTMEHILVATLGNSLSATQGMVTIAVGSPLGTNYSILTGSITSTTNSISTIDSNYTVFTTDIVASRAGSGALIDVNGNVIGLVMQRYSSADDENTLTALSISELKTVIEMLSNGEDIPYLGLELSTVTGMIEREYDIPKGAYIKEVHMDSPAMAAGLQSGDVITELDGEKVFNVDSYETKLLSMQQGESLEIKVQRQGPEGYAEIICTAEIGILQ